MRLWDKWMGGMGELKVMVGGGSVWHGMWARAAPVSTSGKDGYAASSL
jgi:hypothetical protein